MVDALDELSSVREGAIQTIRSTLDFIQLEWIPEIYESIPLMWVRPATVESLEHAAFPLLQISICLSSDELLDDFGCAFLDSVHNAMRKSICDNHILAAYTVPTNALFRSIPTLPGYMASWLATPTTARCPTSSWAMRQVGAQPDPCLCLAHTYDPACRIGYSFR